MPVGDTRNWLKGATGDALHAILCGAGHNLRMILAHLRVLLCAVLVLLTAAAGSVISAACPPTRASGA